MHNFAKVSSSLSAVNTTVEKEKHEINGSLHALLFRLASCPLEWHAWALPENSLWAHTQTSSHKQVTEATQEDKQHFCAFAGLCPTVVFVSGGAFSWAQLLFWVTSPKVDWLPNSIRQAVSPAHLRNNTSVRVAPTCTHGHQPFLLGLINNAG